MNRRLPAEWEPQDAVLLAWPHAESDWAPLLAAARINIADIVAAISRYQTVLLLVSDDDQVASLLSGRGAVMENVQLIAIPTNDTWARDFGPITVEHDEKPLILDFTFNGWGMKFAAADDNMVTRRLQSLGVFGATKVKQTGLVLEGGSIESDGRGTLLTTTECLLEANRNAHLNRDDIETMLREQFGALHQIWLDHGYLAGDDTDSHIDTLARLCPDDTICYVRCLSPEDEHFEALTAMEHQLANAKTPAGHAYRLVPLPMAAPCFDDEGQRLPATYANYLVINNAVLVPTYDDPERDQQALAAIGEAYPGRDIIGIDCRTLIIQHGSLHCVTMQIPQGVLA